jgi:Carboxypeptidase regulatory-like domain
MLEDSPHFDEHGPSPHFSLTGWIARHIRFLLAIAGVFAALSVLFLLYTVNHHSLPAGQPGGLDGCVVSANGNPVPATVWVDKISRPTAADGCFFFAILSPGSHEFHVEAAGKQVWSQSVDIQSSQAVGLQNISVNP